MIVVSQFQPPHLKMPMMEFRFFESNPRRKQFSVSHCMSQRENRNSRGGGHSVSGRPSDSEDVISPAYWNNTNREVRLNGGLSNGRNGERFDLGEPANEGKVKIMNLKLGRVPRAMHGNGGTGDGSSRKYYKAIRDFKSSVEQNLQGNSDDSVSPEDKGFVDLLENSDKDFSAGIKASSMGRTPGKNREKQEDSPVSVRKSKRAPKRRAFNGEFSDEDDDGEIRYMEKLQSMKRKPSRVSDGENVGRAKSRSGDMDEEGMESAELLTENKREMTITTRQRALLHPSSAGSSLIEFPDGLPPARPRKQKEKLSAEEQQLRKAEAAQRRKIVTEKAARESEAEAIRKILGQDSSRKKREDKIRKRQEELAQKKAAHERMVATSFIRTVMGPSGTTVTFPKDSLPPSLFNSKPSSYPAPREKCAGPSCSNPYKYRDSKTNLPLCSLQCYKAVQVQYTPA